ncbi:hypothetical protein FNV43_RR25454 [Rhamnella rubrinervis]|uniref:RNase H type-1 domain-containing protein n=1 Tax=Rhamnella rubrinervis TaxID=2594499 RepID=A0A8K0GR55_9ROSA|nr:hypothetical protein FNV43_RR25454 [Rhamnella rubrinervis]
MGCDEFLIFSASLFYTIWRGRCSHFFKGEINWFKYIGHFNVAVEEFLTVDHKNLQDISPTASSSSVKWCLPQQGFIKANVDAAFDVGQAAVAMVVRNDQGYLLYLASKLLKCVSSFVAEVEVLRWAVEYAEQCAWRRVEWETDAKEVEAAVNSKEDPTCCIPVPGGAHQDTGFPMFLHKKMFMVFVLSDSISLFSSTTSVLKFLGILTSRYAEEDYLKSLPKKMIIGLSTPLFLSIATMMIAYCWALLVTLEQKSWIFIPIVSLTSVPVTLFVLMQLPLLVEIYVSTYGAGIFDRKVKNWLL